MRMNGFIGRYCLELKDQNHQTYGNIQTDFDLKHYMCFSNIRRRVDEKLTTKK